MALLGAPQPPLPATARVPTRAARAHARLARRAREPLPPGVADTSCAAHLAGDAFASAASTSAAANRCAALQRAVHHKDLDVALTLLDALSTHDERAGLSSATCSSLVLALCERARAGDADRAAQSAAAKGEDTSCSANLWLEHARRLLWVTRAHLCCVVPAVPGVPLSVAAVRALVRAQLAACKPERAVAVFRAHQQAGLQLPASAYTDLIACVAGPRAAVRVSATARH